MKIQSMENVRNENPVHAVQGVLSIDKSPQQNHDGLPPVDEELSAVQGFIQCVCTHE